MLGGLLDGVKPDWVGCGLMLFTALRAALPLCCGHVTTAEPCRAWARGVGVGRAPGASR